VKWAGQDKISKTLPSLRYTVKVTPSFTAVTSNNLVPHFDKKNCWKV